MRASLTPSNVQLSREMFLTAILTREKNLSSNSQRAPSIHVAAGAAEADFFGARPSEATKSIHRLKIVADLIRLLLEFVRILFLIALLLGLCTFAP